MVRHADGGADLARPDEARHSPQDRIGNVEHAPRHTLLPRSTTWNGGSFGSRCQAGGLHNPDSLSGLGLPTYAYRRDEPFVNLRTRFAYAQVGACSADVPAPTRKGRLPAGTRAQEMMDPVHGTRKTSLRANARPSPIGGGP
jgi:hypothetical protein